MKNIGLVFSGGGGKGAYEIGVWKALKEFNIDKNIKAVSGTSVGALNGALFASNQYEEAKDIWFNISSDKILKFNINKIINFLPTIPPHIKILINQFSSSGMFSQKGLKEIIDNYLDIDKLKTSGINFYINASEILISPPFFKANYTKINEISDSELIKKYLLASAAIPGVFSELKIKGKRYYDGGLTDNTPILPIVENEKIDYLIIVMLSNDPLFDKIDKKYKNIKKWKIVPTKDVGNFFTGTLNFNKTKAKQLFNNGYEDTKRILENLKEFLEAEKKYKDNSIHFKNQDDSFKKIILDSKDIDKLFSGKSNKYLEEKNNSNIELVASGKQEVLNNSIDDKNKKTLISYKNKLDRALSEGEKAILDNSIDELITSMQDNSDELSKLAFDSITELSSTVGRIEHLQNQSFFKRLWNNFTGKNQKLTAGILSSQNAAIHANTQMIKKLSQRSALTMDAIISIGNKVNYAMLSIKKQELQMLEQKQELLTLIENLKTSTINALEYIENRINYQDLKIEKLEYGQNLLFWKSSIKSKYLDYSSADKVLFATTDYIKISKNYSPNEETHFFRSALLSLVNENETISRKEFTKNILENPKIRANLKQISNNTSDSTPKLIKDSKNIDSGLNLDNIIKDYDQEDELKLIDLATEIFFELKNYNKQKIEKIDSKDYYIHKIEKIEKILNINSIDLNLFNIKEIKEKINNFKLKIIILGKNEQQNNHFLEKIKNISTDIDFIITDSIDYYLNNLDVISFFLLVDIRFIFDLYNNKIISILNDTNKNFKCLITNTQLKSPKEREEILKEFKNKFPYINSININLKSNFNFLMSDLNNLISQYEITLKNYIDKDMEELKERISHKIKGKIKKNKALELSTTNLEKAQKDIALI